MKKPLIFLVVLLAVLASATSLSAQLSKGTLYVGVSKELPSPLRSSSTARLGFSSDISIGRFVKDNVLVGGRFGAGYGQSGSLGTQPAAFNATAHGAFFVRRYIPLTKSIMVPVEAEAGVATGIFSPDGSAILHSHGAYTTVKTGLSLFIGERTSLDLMVGYRRGLYVDKGAVNLTSNVTGSIGLSFYLGARKPSKFQ